MSASISTLFPERIEAAAFIDSMSRAVNGVSVVTTDGPAGRLGITVNTMTSVSAGPPLLLVCINRNSVVHDAIRRNRRFAANVLATHQRDIANRFAGQDSEGTAYSFDVDNWYDMGGSAPLLEDSVASFDCRLVSAMTFGSHSIFVGEVIDAWNSEQTPLLYTGRDYGRPATLN